MAANDKISEDINKRTNKIAADNKHPTANWAIGYMYYTGKIGSLSKYDQLLSFKYFNKARKERRPWRRNI